MRIYLASSWRNTYYKAVRAILLSEGHDVYDFRGEEAFHWQEVNPNYMYGKLCDASTMQSMLSHGLSDRGFDADMRALRECDVCVLLLPCGRSAHLEAGWAIGEGKPVYIFLPDIVEYLYEPELMYKMASRVVSSMSQLLIAIKNLRAKNYVAKGGYCNADNLGKNCSIHGADSSNGYSSRSKRKRLR